MVWLDLEAVGLEKEEWVQRGVEKGLRFLGGRLVVHYREYHHLALGFCYSLVHPLRRSSILMFWKPQSFLALLDYSPSSSLSNLISSSRIDLALFRSPFAPLRQIHLLTNRPQRSPPKPSTASPPSSTPSSGPRTKLLLQTKTLCQNQARLSRKKRKQLPSQPWSDDAVTFYVFHAFVSLHLLCRLQGGRYELSLPLFG